MAVAPRSIPPSGLADPVDPSVVIGADDASPTTLVLQYLKQRGYQPSSENVRRALEANARDPGVIPGLRSDRPATEAEDQAAMRGAGGGRGRPLPVPPIPPEGGAPRGATPPMDRRDDQTTSAQPTSSAAPAPNTSSAPPSTADYNMPGWMPAVAGSGVALANAILNRTPTAEFVGNAQPPSGRVMDVDSPMIGGGGRPGLGAPPPTDMEIAMQRAIAGPSSPPMLGAPPPAIAAPPPRPEAPVAAPGSVITPPPQPEGTGPVPFNSASPRRPPTPEEIAELTRTSTTLRGGNPPPFKPVVRVPAGSSALRTLSGIARVLPR